MEFHILDFIMYFVLLILIWAILKPEYTQDIGGLIGIGVLFIYTVIYIILFGVVDLNWVDLFTLKFFGKIKW